jgi:phospholipid/cholesterol/gamma-HCH transport system ATP-binding protein
MTDRSIPMSGQRLRAEPGPHPEPPSAHSAPGQGQSAPTALAADSDGWVQVRDLHLAHPTRQGLHTVLQGLNFDIRRGEVLVFMGPSGCGKSTLMRALVGLHAPSGGSVVYTDGERETDFYAAPEDHRDHWRRRFGVMFQGGALWSAMSVGENVMLPMTLFTSMSRAECAERAREKLAQVGLDRQFDAATSALSGGMRKRAAIARAMALDPGLLFLDEPSAGLDPLTSARLDALIAQLRTEQGTTIVLVTHELASLRAIGDRALYLDPDTHTQLAIGPPEALRLNGPEAVRRFLNREP